MREREKNVSDTHARAAARTGATRLAKAGAV